MMHRYLILALMITAIILIMPTLARDYAITAENWRINFATDCAIYTNTDWTPPRAATDTGFYTVWITEDPSLTIKNSAVFLFSTPIPISIDRTRLEHYVTSLLSPLTTAFSMKNYSIDDKDGILGEGWADQYGRTAYGAMYPLDPTTSINYETATKFVGFVSLLDNRTTHEILDSLHVEYLAVPQTISIASVLPIQPAASSNYQHAGTREDPIPMGTTVDLGDGWEITVLSVIPDATKIIMDENMFNEPPKSGCQFFMARVQATYTGSNSATFGGRYRLRAVGPSSIGYSTFENSPGVIPDPLPDSEVFTGGTITGNIGWEVKSSDANLLVMYDSPILGGDNENRIYLALYGGPIGSSSSSAFSSDWEWAARGSGKMGRY